MSGTGVPEGFTLPWNTTVTMADVWSGQRAEANRIKAYRMNLANRDRHERELEDRKTYVTSSGKKAFAGYDEAERR